MGTYLRADYGPALAVFGFAFDHGEIRAVPMTGGKMKGLPSRCLFRPLGKAQATPCCTRPACRASC